MIYRQKLPVKKGKAYLPVPSLDMGKYYISAYYPTNNKYKGSYTENTMYINQSAATGVMDVVSATYYNGDHITPIAHFQKEGVPIVNGDVLFRIDEQFIGRYQTDKNGMAIGTPYQLVLAPGEHKLQAILSDGQDYAGTTLTQTINTTKALSDIEITHPINVLRDSTITFTCNLTTTPLIIDEETSIELRYTRLFKNGDTENVTLTQSINPQETTQFTFDLPIFPEEKTGYNYVSIKVNASNFHFSCQESTSFIIKADPHISIVPRIAIGNEYYLFEGNVLDENNEPFYYPGGEITTYLTNTESPFEMTSFNMEIDGTMYMPYIYDCDETTHEFKLALLDQEGNIFDWTNFKTIDDNANWITENGSKLYLSGAATLGPTSFQAGENLIFYQPGHYTLVPEDPPGLTETEPVLFVKYLVDTEPEDWEHTEEIRIIWIQNDDDIERYLYWPFNEIGKEIPSIENSSQTVTIPINPDGSFKYFMKPQPKLGKNQTRVWMLPESKFNNETTTTTNITYIHNSHFEYIPPQKVYTYSNLVSFNLEVTLKDNYGTIQPDIPLQLYSEGTLTNTVTTNQQGKAQFTINVENFKGRTEFSIKATDPETNEEIESVFHTYVVHRYYSEILTAETTMEGYEQPILNLQIYLESIQDISPHTLFCYDSQEQKVLLAQNFIEFTEETIISTQNGEQVTTIVRTPNQHYTIQLPPELMSKNNLTVYFNAEEYLGENDAYAGITISKTTPMIQSTQIKNSSLDTETITNNTAHQITADNQDHTITFFVTNKTTNEPVNEGRLTIKSTLVETLGTLRTNLTLTANPTTVQPHNYVTLTVQLTDQYNEPVTNQPISLYEDSTLIGTITTNSSGVASRNVEVTSSNSSVLYRAQFLGDYIFDGSDNTALVTIEQPVNPLDGLLISDNWTNYQGYNPTSSSQVNTNKNIATTATTISFSTRSAYVYYKTMADFFDPTQKSEQRFIAKRTSDGRCNIGFINIDTGHLLGYVCSTTQQLTFRNDETGYSYNARSQEIKYNEWNEIIFEVDNNTMNIYYENQQDGSKTVRSIPLGTSSWDKWHFMVAPYAAGALTLTTDTNLIQHTARGE